MKTPVIMPARAALTAISILLFSAACPGAALPAPNAVPVDIFAMSLCPHAVRAENELITAISGFGPQVDLRFYFIGYESAGLEHYRFQSMHGPAEVAENMRQVCAFRLDSRHARKYVLERNKDINNPDGWRKASAAAGLDAAALEDCADGPTGAKWYSENLSTAKSRGVGSSPTIEIGGKPYTGPRTRSAFARTVCDAAQARGLKAPGFCAKLPPVPAAGGAQSGCVAAAFSIRIVTEKDCALCRPTLAGPLQQKYPAATISVLDAASAEGRMLIKKHGAATLPLYVLDSGVEKDPRFSPLSEFFARSGEDYIIHPGPGTYLPVVQLGRERIPRRLDLFFESLSPVSAQSALEFLAALKGAAGDLAISWHFVVQEAAPEAPETEPGRRPGHASAAELGRVSPPGALVSAGGPDEIAEDALQLCLFKYAPSILGAYLNCRYQSPADLKRSPSCLPHPGKRVTACVTEGEGMALLRKDAELARALDVQAPALLWENRYGPLRWSDVDWRRLISGGKDAK